MKYLKPINEFWGDVLKRDLLGETREEDKFHSREELQKYLKLEIKKQGENVVIKDLDVSLLEDLSDLFYDICNYNNKTLDLSGWKTGNIKDMYRMFASCSFLKSVNLSGWDTSNVKNMMYMFSNCWSIKSIDLTGWTTSKVISMSHMFRCCNCLKSLDLSSWDTRNVSSMLRMFDECTDLESLDLSGWDTSNVTDMYMMFANCSSLRTLHLSDYNTTKIKDITKKKYQYPAPYRVINNKIVRK